MLFDDSEVIKEFSGDYRFLSNFWPSPFDYKFTDGEVYRFKTVEHFYQSMKFKVNNPAYFLEIIDTDSPGKAKRMGKRKEGYIGDSGWNPVKNLVMRIGVEYKFKDPSLRDMLIATGDKILIEGNRWGDTYWGIDLETGEGKNVLGNILMHTRNNLILQMDNINRIK